MGLHGVRVHEGEMKDTPVDLDMFLVGDLLMMFVEGEHMNLAGEFRQVISYIRMTSSVGL